MDEKEDTLDSGDIFPRFFDMSLDMLCVVGLDGFFKKVNRAMIKTLGWTEEELLTRPWMEFVHAEDRQLTEAAQEKLTSNKKFYFKNRYQDKNGFYHWLSWKAIPVPAQKLIFAVARDITKQKRMEEALQRYRGDLEAQVQERTAVLAAINRIFRQALFCVNEEQLGRICLAAAKKLTGSKIGFIYEADESGSFHTIAINVPGWFACELPPAANSHFRENWKICGIPGQVIESGKTLICNDPASHPDWLELSKGQLVITSFLGVPLKHLGQTVGMIGLANREGGYDKHIQEDVEALAVAVVEALMRKRAEGKLAQLRRHHELILSSASEGILGLDLHGKMTFVNPAAAAMLGYEVEELLGRNAHEIWHHTKANGSPYPPAECPNLATLAGGVHFPLFKDDFFWRKDGTGFPVRCGRNSLIQQDQVSGAVVTFQDITAWKQAEEALRRSEEEYRLLVNQVPAVVFRGYADWSVDFFDEKVEELTGYPKADFDARKVKWCDLIPEEDFDGAQRVFIEALKNDKSYVREHRIRRKDGEIRWVQCHGQIFCDANEKVTHISGVTFDVTKRRQTEEKLRESEELHRQIVETALEGIWIIDAGNRVTFANNRIMEMLGYSLDEVIGEPISKFMDREWLEKASTLITEHLLKGNKEHLDFKLRHKDGRELWVIMTASPMFDAAGRYAGSLGMVTNITARKQAEEALRESEQRFRDIAENAVEWIWEVDPEGKYTYSSPVVEKLLGYTPAEVLGKHFSDFFLPEEREEVRDAALATFEAKQPFLNFINRNLRKDGETIWLSTSGIPVLDASGNLLGYRGADINITERQKAEEELRESEQRFRNMFEKAADAILLADVNTKKFLMGNEMSSKMLGYSPAEIRQLGVMEIHPPEALPHVIEQFERQVKQEIAVAPDLPVIRKDGSVFYADINSFPMIIKGKIYLMGIFRDITARKQVEEFLRESEEKYRLLVNQIPAVVFKGYADWSIDFFDNKIEAITGYSKKDFDSLKLKWQELILPEDLEEAKHIFIKALKTDRSYIREYRIRRKDGEIRWVQNLGQIFCDARGKIKHVSGVMFDITDRKQGDEAMRQSEEKFRRTFDQSPIGAAMVGLDFRYQRVNAELCRLTGYSKEELFARTFADITHPEDVAVSKEMAQRLAAGEIDHFALEKRYLRKDGKIVWVRLSVRLIKDAAGKPLYYLPMIEDITAHKQADKNLRQSLRQLHKVMGEIVQAMALTVEVRDPYTAGHQRRVTRLAQAIAREMGLSKEKKQAVWIAGTLHDLGKIYIPAEILNRPGELSDLEMGMVKTHPQKGYEILKPIQFPWPVAQIIKQHHERLDGSGYPDGLQGEEILLEARILAVADVVEAMASHRPYREALGIDAALEEISRNRGTLFDREVVDACLKVFKEKSFKFS